ncbi:MAG: D-Ala-D-Ala carboxypeptidase family metallohydrolase [Flavobacteriales bacterium]
MRLSPHFTLAEMTVSQTAARTSTPNIPSDPMVNNLRRLCVELLEPVREIVGSPISISSGFRSPQINALVGGSISSAHTQGFAADIHAHSYGSARKLATLLATELPKRGIKFDQIILEFDRWVHIGLFTTGQRQRGQILTAKKIGSKTHYLSGIV